MNTKQAQIADFELNSDFIKSEIDLLHSAAQLRHSHLNPQIAGNTAPFEMLTAGEIERLEFLKMLLNAENVPETGIAATLENL